MNCFFWLIASNLYAHLNLFLHDRFQINILGLGWLIRHIKCNLVLRVEGAKLYMNSPIVRSNAMQLINRWNEPETHPFLDWTELKCLRHLLMPAPISVKW